MNVTTEVIEGLTKKDGQYFLPRVAQTAIENQLDSGDSNLITSEYFRLQKQYEYYRTLPVPAVINYTGPLTLDAYTAFYFNRNFCIPFVGLRDLLHNPAFQQLPSEINILDIGSGTGAIVLSLLWMFNQQPLSTVTLEITAIDSCAEALNRQEGIIRDAGFNMAHVKHLQQSICDTDSCIKIIRKKAPFNLVFIANCLTETPEQDA